MTPADWFSIQQLYARQALAVDRGDAQEWASTYTEQAVFTSPTFSIVAQGRAQLRDFAKMSHADAAARGEQLRHIVSNMHLIDESDGSARIRAYLMIVATSTAASRIDRMLVVDDHLARQPGEAWLFTRRETFRDGFPR